jgi:hypothetical protein
MTPFFLEHFPAARIAHSFDLLQNSGTLQNQPLPLSLQLELINRAISINIFDFQSSIVNRQF